MNTRKFATQALRRTTILFLLGAVLGTLGDSTHVLSGTEIYSQSALILPVLGTPAWVPVLFGSVAVVLGFLLPFFRALFEEECVERPGSPDRRQLILGLGCFLALWASSGFVPLPTGGARDLVLANAAILMWLIFDRRPVGVALGLGVAALGTCAESLLVHNHVFHYADGSSNVAGVPSWLPWLYFSASVAVGNVGRALVSDGRPGSRPIAEAPGASSISLAEVLAAAEGTDIALDVAESESTLA